MFWASPRMAFNAQSTVQCRVRPSRPTSVGTAIDGHIRKRSLCQTGSLPSIAIGDTFTAIEPIDFSIWLTNLDSLESRFQDPDLSRTSNLKSLTAFAAWHGATG